MNERPQHDLKQRTKAFALCIIRLYAQLPKTTEAQVLGRQVLRSGTSVGAYYREAHRSRSDAEFIRKLEGGLRELEETAYWLELLGEAQIFDPEVLAPALREAGALTGIFIASVTTMKRRINRNQLVAYRLSFRAYRFRTCVPNADPMAAAPPPARSRLRGRAHRDRGGRRTPAPAGDRSG